MGPRMTDDGAKSLRLKGSRSSLAESSFKVGGLSSSTSNYINSRAELLVR